MSNPVQGTGPVEPVEPVTSNVPQAEPVELDPVTPPFAGDTTSFVPVEGEPAYTPPPAVDETNPLTADVPVADAAYAPPLAATDAASYGAETVVPAVAPVAAGPIYVAAPTPPIPKGNRGFGVLIGLAATVVFAALDAGFVYLWFLLSQPTTATDAFLAFIGSTWFYVPVIGFFVAFALLAVIVNRGGWSGYVLGGFVVALFTYGTFIGGALIDQAWKITPAELTEFLSQIWLSPLAVIAFVVAREVPTWFGAIVARRGIKVRAKNAEAQAEYERKLAESPVGYAAPAAW